MVGPRLVVALVISLLCIAGGVLLVTTHPPSGPSASISTSTTTGTASTTVSATSTAHLPPAQSAKGTITGTVLLGPTCPVERMPPDPGCADKPYQTTIRIQPLNSSAPHTTASSDASGAFSVSLAPGTYILSAGSATSMPPRCQPMQVTVTAGRTKTVTMECDTGIR